MIPDKHFDNSVNGCLLHYALKRGVSNPGVCLAGSITYDTLHYTARFERSCSAHTHTHTHTHTPIHNTHTQTLSLSHTHKHTHKHTHTTHTNTHSWRRGSSSLTHSDRVRSHCHSDLCTMSHIICCMYWMWATKSPRTRATVLIPLSSKYLKSSTLTSVESMPWLLFVNA